MHPSPMRRSRPSAAFCPEAALANQTKRNSVAPAQYGQAVRLPQRKGKAAMKTKLTAIAALAFGLGTFALLAQNQPGGPGGPPPGGGGFGGPPGRGHPPAGPLLRVLDANTDGVIDVNEIANASTALKTLDKNGDGILTADELRPPPPGGTNQFGFRPPPGDKPPVPPLLAALDTNGDGELDAAETANAGTSLLKLDTNGDGQLTRDEFCPKGPGGPGGPGGPPGEGGPGAPGDGSQRAPQ
jgi:Ca2+-binding EF-hand superfamily protein